MFALGMGGNERERCSKLTLCGTCQWPTLLYAWNMCLPRFQLFGISHHFSALFKEWFHWCANPHWFLTPPHPTNIWLPVKSGEKTKRGIFVATMWVLVPQGPLPVVGWVTVRVRCLNAASGWGFVALVWSKIELHDGIHFWPLKEIMGLYKLIFF